MNILLLGSLRVRLNRAIHLTFSAMMVEFLNPKTSKVLKVYMERKLALFDRLLKRVEVVNGRPYNVLTTRISICNFVRYSLLQARVISQIQQACHRQNRPEIVKRAEEGLRFGLFPVMITQGKSGSYWMRSKDREVLGIFKPFDEEPYAINNPVRLGSYASLGECRMRSGVQIGEAAHNEVAAYEVDAFFGFHVVPRTYYASFTHQAFYELREKQRMEMSKPKTKYGSFQEFLEGFVSFALLPPECVDALPLDDFQTILFLDVLIGNFDRHLNNIFVGTDKLAAIDHGLCFSREVCELSLSMWRGFPQADQPFHPAVKALANNFPFERLSWRLRKRCFRPVESMNRMYERLVLFKAAINAGLIPKEMSFVLTKDAFRKLVNAQNIEDLAQEIVLDFVTHREERMQIPWIQRWLKPNVIVDK